MSTKSQDKEEPNGADIKGFYDECPIGVCIVHRNRRDLKVLHINKALMNLMGKNKKVRDFLDKPLLEIWSGEHIEDLVRKLKSTTPPDDFVLSIRSDKSDEEHWVKLSIVQSKFEGKNSYVLWATDISANKESEDRLEEEVKKADAMAVMKANFLATMSHEIRTPMQAVFGLLELIGLEKPPQQIDSMVNTAKEASSNLLHILDEILDLAKMDANKMELDMFELPVRTMVAGVLEATTARAQGKELILADEIGSDVPPVVVGDSSRLRQILMNLTGNAVKFTEKGQVVIRVRKGGKVIPDPKHGFTIRFEIIDTGIGIPEEVQENLFQPFNQADSSTSRKYGGTGLGLSICKKLVELMGGQIGIESTLGSGSTFWFEIPTEEVSIDTTVVDLPNLDGLAVLSVEDHPQGAKEIVRSLVSMGAKVDSCQTYWEGRELIEEHPYDVAIIDQGLPDGLGIELMKEIMGIRPDIGMIMYTARADKGLQYSCNTLGIQFLPKPASRLGLGEAVKDAARKTMHVGAKDGPKKLLVAEDTKSVRDVLSRQLEKLGVEVDFVVDGKQALKALKKEEYGMLITDLHMPEIDGYGVVKAIRTQDMADQTKRFPVVAITADVQMAQRQVYMRHGFDESLIKPVSLGQLERLLIRWGILSREEKAKEIEEKAPCAPAAITETGDERPAVDLNRVKIMMGSVDADSIAMLQMFPEMTEETIEDIQNCMKHGDYKALREAAHSLKGSARSACCEVLGDYAAELQDEADLSGGRCEELVGAIVAEFARAREAIAELKPLE